MDDFTKLHYECKFQRAFMSKRGTEFQDFFSDIMERRYPGEFVRVRPWGNIGDRKNDGYLLPAKRVYQVYAPREMSQTEAVNKIEEDFTGAIANWPEMREWTFVHNDMDGLGPGITAKLDEIASRDGIAITQMGYQGLSTVVFELGKDDLAFLFGPAPTLPGMHQVRFADLELVVSSIALTQAADDIDIRRVSQDKLRANALSVEAQGLLEIGMRKADLVRQFFDEHHDPLLGDKLASTFRKKYVELRDAGTLPEELFHKLFLFAGGAQGPTPRHINAVYAVLAFLFEQCDIFENARVGASS